MNTIIILAIVVVLFAVSYIISAIQQKKRNDELNYLNHPATSTTEEEDETDDEDKDEDENENKDDKNESEDENEDKDEDDENEENEGSDKGCLISLLTMIGILVIGGFFLFRACADDYTSSAERHVYSTVSCVDEVCEESNFNQSDVDFNITSMKRIFIPTKDNEAMIVLQTVYDDGTTKLDTLSRSIVIHSNWH